MPDDIYAPFERGLHQLQERLDQNSPFAADAGTLAFRLNENIHAARIYGDDENRRSSRAAIVHQLDLLTRGAVGKGFAELCGPGLPANLLSDGAEDRMASITFGDVSGNHNMFVVGNSVTLDTSPRRPSRGSNDE